jgi:negative regulator of sigma E activity
MKTKQKMYSSPLAMFAFFLGRAEAYRLAAKHSTEIGRMKVNREMMRNSALAAIRSLKRPHIGDL